MKKCFASGIKKSFSFPLSHMKTAEIYEKGFQGEVLLQDETVNSCA